MIVNIEEKNPVREEIKSPVSVESCTRVAEQKKKKKSCTHVGCHNHDSLTPQTREKEWD